MTHALPTLPACIIVAGGDSFLGQEMVLQAKRQAHEQYKDVDEINLDASQDDQYAFEEAISPSLFSEAMVVTIDHLQDANPALGSALVEYCQEMATASSYTTLVICRHMGGNKGKKLIDSLRKAGAQLEQVPDLKKADDKLRFVYQQFEQAGRKIEPQAAQLLVNVLGERTAELAAMCQQLCCDFDDDPMTVSIVQDYLTDNPQATGFLIAKMALAGRAAQAITAMRAGLEQGVDVLSIVGALSWNTRLLAKAAAVDSGSISQAEAKIAPWQLRNAKAQLRGWTSAGLAKSIEALAVADEQRKGSGGDPAYALEKAIRIIATKGGGR